MLEEKEEAEKICHCPSEKKGRKSEALWMLSFSDMSLLLLCFFVLMLSIMKPDKKKYEYMKDGLSAKTTKLEKNLHAVSEDIKKVIKEKKLENAASVNYDSDGLHIEFKDGLLFQVGSAEPNPKFKKVVNEVMQVISSVKDRYEMKIEGHTDDIPVGKGSKFPSNWELSAARGITLMRSFQDMGVKENHLSVVAYAHTKPKVPYEKLKGKDLQKARAANRRVVIWLE